MINTIALATMAIAAFAICISQASATGSADDSGKSCGIYDGAGNKTALDCDGSANVAKPSSGKGKIAGPCGYVVLMRSTPCSNGFNSSTE